MTHPGSPLRFQLRPYSLPLRRPWRSAAGVFAERRGLLVVAEDQQGQCGYGDCAPLPRAGGENLEDARAWLSDYLNATTAESPASALTALPTPGDCPAARCGLETALLDLCSRQARQPLSRYLQPNAASSVRVNANIGALDQHSIDRLPAVAGYTIIKLKVGLRPVADEIDSLRQLQKVLAPGTRLRLDANRAWSMDEARHIIPTMAELPVESLEEPLRDPDLGSLAQLQRLADYPLAVDESITRLDIRELLRHAVVARLVLKPMVLGGLLPSLALARQAREAGIDAIVTTTVDSAVGCRAAVHLAAALDGSLTQPAPCHGLATSDWLLRDVAEPLLICNGAIHIGDYPGLGPLAPLG